MSTTPNDLFIEASRRKLRFNSNKGSLNVDDLWDVPLEFLDNLAVALEEQIQKAGKKSFLAKRSASTLQLDISFEIAKYVLETRVAEDEARKDKASKEAKRSQLKALLEEKQMEKIKGQSVEEIEAQLASL